MTATMFAKQKKSFLPAIINCSIVTMFLLFSSMSYSQLVGQGELMDNSSLEQVLKSNRANGKESYQSLFSNFHFKIDVTQPIGDVNTLIKKLKTISGVLDASFDSNRNEVIVVTQKSKENPMQAILKENISSNGFSLIDISELIYKN